MATMQCSFFTATEKLWSPVVPLKKPEYQDFITAEENHSVEQQLLDLGSEKLMITDDYGWCATMLIIWEEPF